MSNVENLYIGNKKCDTLFNALQDVIAERAIGMTVVEVIGILELLKDFIKKED